MRRHDTGRTFILPGKKLRKKAVSEKFSFNTPLLQGKSVTVLDDSEVRGTTSEQVVVSLRNRGVTEVHWRNCSPQVIESCFYGIATADKSQLIAANNSLEEMRIHMDADSLEFLSLEDFKAVVSSCGLLSKHGCYTCMDGIRWDTQQESPARNAPGANFLSYRRLPTRRRETINRFECFFGERVF